MPADPIRDALLPCPFCGTPAPAHHQSSSSDERNGYNFTVTISCMNCTASVHAASHQGKAGWCDDTGQADAEAISKWNRRARAQGAETPSVPVARCACGYPMPCVKTVPLSFCRAGAVGSAAIVDDGVKS